jgi:hypothetical protein
VLLKNDFSSYQISRRVFELTRSGSSTDAFKSEGIVLSGFDASKGNVKKDCQEASACSRKTDVGNHLLSRKDHGSKSVPFELYKRRTTVFVRRETFLDIVCDVLAEYKYVGPNQRADLMLACRYLYLFDNYFDRIGIEVKYKFFYCGLRHLLQ